MPAAARCQPDASGDAQPPSAALSALPADLGNAQAAWRRVVATAIQAGIPVPGFSAALTYYDAVRSPRLPAALLQGLRDYFRSHTYRRVDKPGTFHTQWSGDGTEVQW